MAKIKFTTSIRNAMAQVTIDALDAGTSPGKLKFYTAPMEVWAANTAYLVGNAVYMNGHVYECTVAGTSSGSAPAWPASGTVTDGGVTWTEAGTGDVLLGTLTLSDSAGTVATGSITFGAITQDNAADATGKARRAALLDSDDTLACELDVTATGGDGAIKLNTVNIVAGGPILMNSLVITMGGA